MNSPASNRFEKGIDANLVPGGLWFASRLLAELCGGTVAPGTTETPAALHVTGNYTLIFILIGTLPIVSLSAVLVFDAIIHREGET